MSEKGKTRGPHPGQRRPIPCQSVSLQKKTTLHREDAKDTKIFKNQVWHLHSLPPRIGFASRVCQDSSRPSRLRGKNDLFAVKSSAHEASVANRSKSWFWGGLCLPTSSAPGNAYTLAARHRWDPRAWIFCARLCSHERPDPPARWK